MEFFTSNLTGVILITKAVKCLNIYFVKYLAINNNKCQVFWNVENNNNNNKKNE